MLFRSPTSIARKVRRWAQDLWSDQRAIDVANDLATLIDDLSTPAQAEADQLRPMAEAPKDKTAILARIRRDLATFAPNYGLNSPDHYAGLYVVVRHPGLAPDGFDTGWSLAGPFGQGLGTDQYFDGWMPLPDL